MEQRNQHIRHLPPAFAIGLVLVNAYKLSALISKIIVQVFADLAVHDISETKHLINKDNISETSSANRWS